MLLLFIHFLLWKKKNNRWKIAVNKSFDLSHTKHNWIRTILTQLSYQQQINVTYDTGLHHCHFPMYWLIWRWKLFPFFEWRAFQRNIYRSLSLTVPIWWRKIKRTNLCFYTLFNLCSDMLLSSRISIGKITRTFCLWHAYAAYLPTVYLLHMEAVCEHMTLSLNQTVCVCVCVIKRNWTMKFSHSSRSSVEIWSSRWTQRRTHRFPQFDETISKGIFIWCTWNMFNSQHQQSIFNRKWFLLMQIRKLWVWIYVKCWKLFVCFGLWER